MLFDVSGLTRAPLGARQTLTLDEGSQLLGDITVGFLRGAVRLTRVQGGLLAEGEVHTQVPMECVRCLEVFSLPLTLELEELFGLPGSRCGPDVRYIISEDGWLNLAPLLREQVWVGVPMKPTCRPDCRGLCPQCGCNRNVETCTCEAEEIDPRLVLLKGLLEPAGADEGQ